MRLLISVGIVALYVAIKTIAAQSPTETQPSSNDDFELQPLRVLDEMIDAAKTQQALDLVFDRYEKFFPAYLRIWRNITDTYIVAPLLEFIDLAKFHYGQEKTLKNAVIEGLGLAADDPEIVKLGLRALIEVTNIYLSIGPFCDEPPIENNNGIWTGLSKLCRAFDRRSPNAGRSCRKGVWQKWDFHARPSSVRSFHLNANEEIDTETVYIRDYALYGNLPSHDSTVVGFRFMEDEFGNSLGTYFVRPNSEEGLSTIQPEEIDVKELAALPVKYVHVNIPTFKVQSNFTVADWAPQFFGSTNPFKPAARNPLKISSSKFLFKDFSRYLSFKVRETIGSRSRTSETRGKSQSLEWPRSLKPAINFPLDRPFLVIIAATGRLNAVLFVVAVGHSGFQ